MLTLTFNNTIAQVDAPTQGGRSRYSRYNRNTNTYYRKVTDLIPMNFRFSPLRNQLPYFVAANSSLHKRGVLHISTYHPLGSRGINMITLKEVIENAPVGIRVKFLSNDYIVGKGFISKVVRCDSTTYADDKLKLLFVVAQDKNKPPLSPNDLTIYLDRELYEPQYKRIMSILKPYMADHKGDIIVTRSVNDYFIYEFKLPTFPTVQRRFKFEDNMKEFFFRSIKWSKWRKEEDARLEKIEAEKEILRQKKIREKDIQEALLNVINNENIRVSQQVIEPELVEEVPTVMGELPSQTEGDLITEWEATVRREGHAFITQERHGEIPQRSTSTHHSQRDHGQQHQETLSQLPVQEQETTPLSSQQLIQELRSLGTNGPQQEQELEDMSEELTPLDSSIPQNTGEYVSPEEMAMVMNRFAIAQPVDLEYSTLLHAATGIPLDQITPTVVHETQYYVDSNTEVIIEEEGEYYEDEPDEEELERLHSASEEELDNDPDAYEEAEVIPSNSDERSTFRAMEGGTDGG